MKPTNLAVGMSLFVLGCQDAHFADLPKDQAEPAIDERQLLDGEEQFGEGFAPIADIHIGKSRIIFVEVAGSEGAPPQVATIEQIAPSSPDPSLHERLVAGTPLDLFLAIAPDAMIVPEALLAYENQNLGARGWFISEPLIAEQSAQPAACSDSSFRASLRNWRPEINDGERWRLNTGVGDGPNWTGPTCGIPLGCDSPSFFSLNMGTNAYSIFNVDEMKQRVAICSMNTSRRVCSTYGGCNSHLGPIIAFRFRTENNASTGTPFRRDMTAGDLGTTWRWRWHGDSSPGQANWDWRITIEAAKNGDLFDLGWIFEHRGF